MATRSITPAESEQAQRLLANARRAMDAISGYDQAKVDRLCQAVAWAAANPDTAARLANMSVDESGMGSREPSRRAKVLGILRDALRQKSMGIIEELPEKGIVKYAKPAGVICSLIPVTSPVHHADRHRDLRDQVQGRGDLLAASVEQEDDQRNRAADARGAEGAWCSGRRAAVRRAAEHSAGQRADVDLRPDDRHRRSGDGQGGVRLRQAGLRRRRRQRHDGDRRDRRHRRGRAQHRDQQDQRPRIGLFGRRQPGGRRPIYDALLQQLQQRGRVSRQRRGEAAAAAGLLGRGGPPHRRHHRAAGAPRSPRRPASRFPPTRRSSWSKRTSIGKQHPVLDREARRRARGVQVRTASTTRSTRCGRSSRPAAAATPAASTRSTTTTSIASR